MRIYLMIAAFATFFAGCSKDTSDDTVPNPLEEQPIEIKGNAGVLGVETRAPINNGSSMAAQFVASATTNNYTTNAWTAISTFAASGSQTSFSFTPAQYYPVNGSTVYIKGYYPAVPPVNNIVTYSTFDGTQDVMLSNQVSGTKAVSSALAFTFSHLLTQLQFNLVAGTGYGVSTTVTSIIIRSQQTVKTLNVNDGSMTYNTADLTLAGPFAISTSGSVAAAYPMVASGVSIVLSVTTSDGVTYPDAPVTLTTVAGKAHIITLTFTPKAIITTAAVTAWDTTGTGGSSSLS